VISTFDRPAALTQCLRALLLQQTPHRIEIVVIDNHPQSGITMPLVAQFPTVRWLQEPAAGLSRARNLGIAAAHGAIIVTTDDDVLPPPDWLEHLTGPFFVGDTNLAATTGNCLPYKVETEAEVVFEAYGGLQHGDRPTSFDAVWMAQWHIAFPQLWRIGTTANAAFLASVLRDPRVGLFETRLGVGSPAGAWEDIYCFYRILRAGFRINYLPDAELLHAHRERMSDLTRQLCAYRRGETAFLTMILLRHRDLRALGQAFLWIPYWRLRLLLEELSRRIIGRRRFPLRLLLRESLAYLAGPLAWWRSR
jgi:glycosyltransferase involved in cell wall biosynthesis